MYIQTKVEELNQGVATIAVMKTLKLTDTNTGKEVDLYTAIDEEGNLDEKYSYKDVKERGLSLLTQLTADIIRPVVMKTSGNYIDSTLMERSMFGKRMAMFTKWMPELIVDRIHARKFDYILNKETEGKLFGFVKAIVYTSTGKYGEIDKITLDAARKGAYEIAMVTAMKILYFAFAKIICDEPNCEKERGVTLYMLNTFGQLTDDVLGLVNPGQWYSTMVRPFAVENVINEWWNFAYDFGAYLIPGDSGLYEQNGKDYKKNDAKFWRHVEKLTPVYRTNVYNIQKSSTELKSSGILKSYLEE
jgi:hypothetical protein